MIIFETQVGKNTFDGLVGKTGNPFLRPSGETQLGTEHPRFTLGGSSLYDRYIYF